jgi:hypothetical protein
MKTTENTENDDETTPSESSTVNSLILIVYLGGILVEIIITGLAILLNSDFLIDQNYISDYGTELVILGITMIGLFIVAILVAFSILLVISKIRGEEKISIDIFFNLSFILILGVSILIYLFAFPLFPLLQDPFNLMDINNTLSILYGLLWFVGFFFTALLVLVIIYIMLDSA